MNTQIDETASTIDTNAIDHTNHLADLIINSVFNSTLSIIVIALFWALLGFILCVVVLIILKKKKLFKRDIKLWHYLSMLQYPAWMAVFVSASLCLGLAKGVHSQAQSAFDKHAALYIESMTPIISQNLVNIIPELNNAEPITIRQISNRLFDDLMLLNEAQSGPAKITSQTVNWVSRKIGQWIVLKAVDAIITYALESTGKAIDLESSDMTFNQETFIDYNFQDFEDTLNDLIHLALKKRIERVKDSVENIILLMALVCILGFLLDPLAYYCWKKYQKKQQ